MLYIKILSSFIFILSACSKTKNSNSLSSSSQNSEDSTTITYQESTEDFPNPERGFYRTAETSSSDFVPLDKNTLIQYRSSAKVLPYSYSVNSSLIFRQYVLDNFKDKPLSNDFLQKLQADFDIARQAGVKLILRFNYTVQTHGGCPEGICPPYGDAPKAVVLEHITQLKPYLQQNADVIAVLQEGFIGIWGEGYYSDYFGDASSNGNGKLLDQNWNDRNDVIKALLDALPFDRMLEVRYPEMKQRFIYGVNAAISSAPLTEQDAFQITDKARIAFHNDAFLSNASEMGTFIDYGNSNSPRNESTGTIKVLKEYAMAEGRYLAIGGETDDPDNPAICDCVSSGGQAEIEMRDFHYSFLNAEYHPGVIKKWFDHGCLDAIKEKLGYRFVLKSGSFPKKISKNDKLTFRLDLSNEGYAAPFNARPVQLVLKNKTSGEVRMIPIDTDIRKWYSGNIHLNQSLILPPDIAPGQYDLFLNMPDNSKSLFERPEYSIRVANSDVWVPDKGYNKLNSTIEIQ